MSRRRLTGLRAIACAGLLAIALVGARSAAASYSDMWWNPAESGWGANIVQQDEILFVTLFVYDDAGRAAWFVAPETRTIGYGADGRSWHTGPLFRTRGPYHAGPFDPTKVAGEPVGELSVAPETDGRIRLEYAVDGRVVSKVLERQTFREAYVAATYLGSFAMRYTAPGEPLEARQYAADTRVYIADGSANLFLQIGPTSCHYGGAYRQSGRLGSFAGGFACNDGNSGTFEVTEFEVNDNAISGRLRASGTYGVEYGRFAGPRL